MTLGKFGRQSTRAHSSYWYDNTTQGTLNPCPYIVGKLCGFEWKYYLAGFYYIKSQYFGWVDKLDVVPFLIDIVYFIFCNILIDWLYRTAIKYPAFCHTVRTYWAAKISKQEPTSLFTLHQNHIHLHDIYIYNYIIVFCHYAIYPA